MMKSRLLFYVLAISVSGMSVAEESPPDKTLIRIYSVGDLVSAGAMKSTLNGTTTSKEWASEYPETIQALENLADIVESLCDPKPIAVKCYAPTLSLIVRHSQAGHDEIAVLLRSLGQANEVSIHMECRPLFSGDTPMLKQTESTEATRKRLEVLLTKPLLDEDETQELLALVPPVGTPETVLLKSGRRTAWGSAWRPCTAMARIDEARHSVEIRLDYLSDDFAEQTPFGSRVITLQKGQSVLFQHYCDGETVVWLVTASIVGSEKPARITAN